MFASSAFPPVHVPARPISGNNTVYSERTIASKSTGGRRNANQPEKPVTAALRSTKRKPKIDVCRSLSEAIELWRQAGDYVFFRRFRVRGVRRRKWPSLLKGLFFFPKKVAIVPCAITLHTVFCRMPTQIKSVLASR
jgi:hypothetical protein